MTKTLVHAFRVPEGREDEFFEGWKALTAELDGAPGYLGTKLLKKSDDGVGEFAFVNIALWESKDAWKAAVSTPEFTRHLPSMKDFESVPGLYDVVFEQ